MKNNDIADAYEETKQQLDQIKEVVDAANAWHTAEASLAMHKIRRILGLPV